MERRRERRGAFVTVAALAFAIGIGVGYALAWRGRDRCAAATTQANQAALARAIADRIKPCPVQIDVDWPLVESALAGKGLVAVPAPSPTRH